MLDQFENPVPLDLVVLASEPQDLSEDEVKKVMALPWYQPSREHHLGWQTLVLVSRRALDECIDGLFDVYSLEDAGLKHLHGVELIADVLKRHASDMFYHA